MRALRIYIVGAGFIARTHAAAAEKLQHPGGILLSAADPDDVALAVFAAAFPGSRTFDDAYHMLSEPARTDDIVVIATPPHGHAELTCHALQTGRHVLCEKPLAMDRLQAERMLAAARGNDRLLGCCSCRFLGQPTTEEAKRLLRMGALGEPYYVTFVQRWQRSRSGIEYQPESRWFLDRSRSGGGVLMDMGPYDFTLLADLLSPLRVDVLSAWLARPVTDADPAPPVVYDVEGHAGACLLYHLRDGTAVPVTYERAGCTHGEERTVMEIEGTKGAVRWDWLMWKREGSLTWSCDQGGSVRADTLTLRNETGLSHFDRPLYSFYQRCRGKDAPLVANEQAVFNFSVLRAVYDCATARQPQSVRR
jgi:predicted dehydrogenase